MFTKKLVSVAAICLVVSVFLAISLLVSGPRIRKTIVNAEQLTESTGQTIVLKSNQPIQPVQQSQVSINPAVDYTVTSSGDSLIIQLKQRLNYSTTYTISATDLQSIRGKKSNYQTSFTTKSAEFFYLKRNFAFSYGDKVPDQIKSGDTNTIIYSAPRIYDFDYIDNQIVVQSGDDDENTLSLFDTKSQMEESIILPERGTIDNLYVSPNKKLIGFTLSTKPGQNPKTEYTSTLFLYDMTSKIITPVIGLDKQPVRAINWRFAPDGTSLLVQSYETGTLFIDSTRKNQPIPIGSFQSIGNISGDGTTFVAYDGALGPVTVDVQSKQRTPSPVTTVPGTDPYVTSLSLMGNSRRVLREIDSIAIADNSYSQTIELGKGSEFRKLYDINPKELSVHDVYATTNDQYLALEISDSQSNQKYDDYNYNSRPRDVKTRIIQTSDSSTYEEVEGFNIVWKN